MATAPVKALLRMASDIYGLGWEMRRQMYARGWWRQSRVGARVVSVGNLTVGGTGKTTLVLHLARLAREAGHRCAVVCRRYRPGPGGQGDEELLYVNALGAECVYAGTSKRDLAARASAEGAEFLLVDDGFSHWALARDLDVVLVDSQDPLGGRELLPSGRLREPIRALQRAGVIVASRLGPGDHDPDLMRAIQAHAPAALLAAGRHRPAGFWDLEGGRASVPVRCHLMTATGNPEAVARTVRETGVEVASLKTYRDHHWFSEEEARIELQHAEAADAALLVTQKDAVRWPAGVRGEAVRVVRVEWEWAWRGALAEDRIFEGIADAST